MKGERGKMKQRINLLPLAALCIILLSGCSGSGGNSGMQSYKETKSMVIDIIKSEDGLKAIEEAATKGSTEEGMKLLSENQSIMLKSTVREVMTDPSFDKQMEKLMTDTKFAGEFAKAISKENKSMHKELLKDPEYQMMLVDVFKSPDAEKLLLEVLKGAAYRKQAMTIFQESLQSPIFRLELLELMKKAIEEESKPKAKKKDEQGSADGDGGGDGGGGGSEGGGGQ
jgi:spore germination protein D